MQENKTHSKGVKKRIAPWQLFPVIANLEWRDFDVHSSRRERVIVFSATTLETPMQVVITLGALTEYGKKPQYISIIKVVPPLSVPIA